MNITTYLNLLTKSEKLFILLQKTIILIANDSELKTNHIKSIVIENIFEFNQVKATFFLELSNKKVFEYYLFYKGDKIGEFYSKSNVKGYLENTENDFEKEFDKITPNEIYHDFLDEYYLFKGET